jgi:hypothetical protein
MVLYVTLVLLAELAVLPERRGGDESSWTSGQELIAIIWGTTIGLALAHWFAFRLAVRAFGSDHTGRYDLEIGLAQVGGAALVAAIATIPVIVFPDDMEYRSVHSLLAVELGVVGYIVARLSGQRRWPAFGFGVLAMLVGLVVVSVKIVLDH